MGEKIYRKINARVEVSFGNEEIAGALNYSSDDSNPISRYECLYNNNHTPSVSAFTLEGGNDHALSTNRGLIDPEVTGWWSKSMSESDPTENGDYLFAVPPSINIYFGSARPIKLLQVYGDPKLDEYPVRLSIKLFRETADKEIETTACYSHEFINGALGNTGWEGTANWEITLTDAYTDDEKEVLLQNGYIPGIVKATVTVISWNKPLRVSKIYRCYDDIIERYEMDELKSFDCVREMSNTDEISYGLVSGSCSVTLLNNKGRKFDYGYLKNMAHINRRIVPFINEEKLGSFYIKEWDISQDDMFVKCDASDKLVDFQDITFEGRMPHSDKEKISFKQLFEIVLDSANKNSVKSFAYEIDDTLSQVSIEPYLPRKSIWDVLQMLCEASMSFIYVDKNDVVKVCSELVAPQIPNYTEKEADGTVSLEYDNTSSAANDTSSADINDAPRIDPDNAFSISVPFFADMETNQVEIGYYRKVIKEDQELYRESEIEATSENIVTKIIELDKFCIITSIKYKDISYLTDQFKVTKVNDSDFKYKIEFEINSSTTDNNDFIVYGQEITFEKQALIVQNTNSRSKNALSLYTHPDCELIQSKELAKNIAARVMAMYPSGTRTVTSEWIGDQRLNLQNACTVKDRFGGEAQYSVTYIKNSVDGGFRQEVKGIRKKLIKEGTYSGE